MQDFQIDARCSKSSSLQLNFEGKAVKSGDVVLISPIMILLIDVRGSFWGLTYNKLF